MLLHPAILQQHCYKKQFRSYAQRFLACLRQLLLVVTIKSLCLLKVKYSSVLYQCVTMRNIFNKYGLSCRHGYIITCIVECNRTARHGRSLT
jgi:hypothetical protein